MGHLGPVAHRPDPHDPHRGRQGHPDAGHHGGRGRRRGNRTADSAARLGAGHRPSQPRVLGDRRLPQRAGRRAGIRPRHRDAARVRNAVHRRHPVAVPSREAEERLLELRAVVDLARRVIREDAIRLWLRTPDPDLGYRKPLDVIAAGEYQRVIDLLLALAEGVTS
ncbi:antitoxin Xre/MbcA/ParS toxin-binding domain-containing protein [Candidatus Poriferisodalis sp.]|uniref:antitoxin Xre/MbcA/ParS toxin-binding domain-containing protein n=1 Tax=Candidatus Poriferisodalis sp. TaxID=3101277 RepID=UPI003D1121F0